MPRLATPFSPGQVERFDRELPPKDGRVTPLKIVLVEGDDHDADRIMGAAHREGMEISWFRAKDEESFLSLLGENPDAVVTDFGMAGLAAPRVLELLRERGADLPILVVTRSIADDLAAECIKLGAADYLLKDRLARLRDAIEEAVERSRALRQRRDAERRLLAAAVRREVLNDMLLRSLSIDITENELRSVIEPLFYEGALPGLVSIVADIPGLAAFKTSRNPAEAVGEAIREGPSQERVIAMAEDGSGAGRVSFRFAAGAAIERESLDFLDDVAYVLSGVAKRARAERSLRRDLVKQEGLLKEIHRRVRDNLAAVQSLIASDAARLEDGCGKTELERLGGEVRSMSLTHELLHSRGGSALIDFQDFVSELRIMASRSLGCPQDSLALVEDCSGFRVPLEDAITLGVIFNQLFMCAAREAASAGRIDLRIEARPSHGGTWRLEFLEGQRGESDEEADRYRQLDLVRALLPQFGGELDLGGGRLRATLTVPGEGATEAS